MILRDFSPAGPCITLGTVYKETKGSVGYFDRANVAHKIMKSGYRWQAGLIHTEPCCCCRDHAQTQYPDGYMD